MLLHLREPARRAARRAQAVEGEFDAELLRDRAQPFQLLLVGLRVHAINRRALALAQPARAHLVGAPAFASRSTITHKHRRSRSGKTEQRSAASPLGNIGIARSGR